MTNQDSQASTRAPVSKRPAPRNEPSGSDSSRWQPTGTWSWKDAPDRRVLIESEQEVGPLANRMRAREPRQTQRMHLAGKAGGCGREASHHRGLRGKSARSQMKKPRAPRASQLRARLRPVQERDPSNSEGTLAPGRRAEQEAATRKGCHNCELTAVPLCEEPWKGFQHGRLLRQNQRLERRALGAQPWMGVQHGRPKLQAQRQMRICQRQHVWRDVGSAPLQTTASRNLGVIKPGSTSWLGSGLSSLLILCLLSSCVPLCLPWLCAPTETTCSWWGGRYIKNVGAQRVSWAFKPALGELLTLGTSRASCSPNSGSRVMATVTLIGASKVGWTYLVGVMRHGKDWRGSEMPSASLAAGI